MPHLPEPKGPYAVGATTIILPIRSSFSIGPSQIRKPKSSALHPHTHKAGAGATEHLEPTLVFEEVAFTAFYPADVDAHEKSSRGRTGGSWFGSWGRAPSKGIDWIPKPIEETLKGFEHFGGGSYPSWVAALIRPVVSWYGASLKVPTYENAPLLAPPQELSRWPLVIFSHGLAGSRTTYSHLCTSLAAHGRVVLALEHRDGTGPVVFPRSPDGTRKTLYYVNPDEVVWPDGAERPLQMSGLGQGKRSKEEQLWLRKDQLEFRRREVYAAVDAMRRMCTSQGTAGLEVMDGTDVDWASWTSNVDFGTMDIVAHSFGGATLLSLLTNPPPPIPSSNAAYPPLPIRRALALDPWLEPLPSAGPEPLPSLSPPELLILNSEGFTLWDAHFASLQRSARAFVPSRILTLIKAQHISFSDFPLITPRRLQGSIDGERMLGVINTLAEAFLQGQLQLDARELKIEGVASREMKVEKDEKGKRKLVGEAGDVIVH